MYLYVPICPAALELLRARAAAERRRPQDEAALLVEKALGCYPALGALDAQARNYRAVVDGGRGSE